MGLSISIDEDCLHHNISVIRDRCKDKKFCAVVKANAYGHGVKQVARAIHDKVDYFAVATVGEGVFLRKIGIDIPILVLCFSQIDAYLGVDYELELGVSRIDQVRSLNRVKHTLQKTPKAHVQVNTGMNRFGKNPEDISSLLECVDKVEICGVYSHIYSVQSIECQIARFMRAEQEVKDNFSHAISHISATDAVVSGVCYGDMVRVGIGMYGYPTTHFKPVMRVSARVLSLRLLQKEDTAGYNGVFTARRDNTLIGIIDGGYADGVFRHYLGKICVLYRDKTFPIVGVCMDTVIVDFSGSEVSIGDIVHYIGSVDNACQYADDLALCAGTIPYEILTGFGNLVRS